MGDAKKVLLREERDERPGSIESRLRDIVCEMERGDYAESDAAVLITRDRATGILTISHMTEDGIDAMKKLFNEAAKLYGYARVV